MKENYKTLSYAVASTIGTFLLVYGFAGVGVCLNSCKYHSEKDKIIQKQEKNTENLLEKILKGLKLEDKL